MVFRQVMSGFRAPAYVSNQVRMRSNSQTTADETTIKPLVVPSVDFPVISLIKHVDKIVSLNLIVEKVSDHGFVFRPRGHIDVVVSPGASPRSPGPAMRN